MKRLSALLALGLFASAAASFGANNALTQVQPREVDAIFAAWAKPGSPGVALAVIRDGRIVYERGYGTADIEHNAPITPETVFYVGSVSKQFTAASIALLAQQGKLSLDDDVRKYVPALPDYGAPITIRQAILHTTGLRDYLALREIAGEPQDGVFGNDSVLALLARQKALNFAPGTRHLYSNSGYFLLSLVVQRASGKSLREFAAANLFGPLDMSTAQFRDDHTAEIAKRAQGYSARPGGGYRINNPNFDVVGAGGVFMTVRDFAKWDQNFYDAKVGGKALIEQLETPGRLNDGSALSYAFGLTTGRYRGLPIVEHSGAYGGFRAHVMRFRDQQFSVVCFTNLETMVPAQLGRKVADLYLANAIQDAAKSGSASAAPSAASGGAPAAARANPAELALSAEKARELVGEYVNDELPATFRISADGATLTLQGRRSGSLRLRPTSADGFAAGASIITFQRDARGAIVSLTLDGSGARGLVFSRR